MKRHFLGASALRYFAKVGFVIQGPAEYQNADEWYPESN